MWRSQPCLGLSGKRHGGRTGSGPVVLPCCLPAGQTGPTLAQDSTARRAAHRSPPQGVPRASGGHGSLPRVQTSRSPDSLTREAR